ncbi:MAG: ferritin-like domain-containing protein [Thermoanaerobaculia bacterium]|nr:ferritin-like domain-containing protein [Thermoanaerobaculia bacterium]
MTKDQLVAHLNEDLAGEYQAILMYLTYAATVTGPHRPMLKQFFESEIPGELAHAQFLAEKISSFHGQPTVTPRPVPVTNDPRQMLENVLAAEKKAIADYKARAKEAEELGDKGLATHLENIVEDETGHYEETEKILRGWHS